MNFFLNNSDADYQDDPIDLDYLQELMNSTDPLSITDEIYGFITRYEER